MFFASGAVLVVELLGLRLLAPYVGLTLETTTAIIGAVLAGIAAGAALGGRAADRVSPRLPWSGRGHSGIGSTLGLAGIRAFVQPKAWHLKTPRP